jgi:O-antigen ligase
VSALVCLFLGLLEKKSNGLALPVRTTALALLITCAFAASLTWTEVDLEFALAMLVKHAKILQIILLGVLIRNAAEARLAIKTFIGGQVFVLISSWLLAAGTPLFWVQNDQTFLGTQNVVFSVSYLDQSIMMAILASSIWHLRKQLNLATPVAAILSIAAVVDAVYLLPGRTGYITSLAVVLLSVYWGLSARSRWIAFFAIPVLIGIALHFGGGSRVYSRVSLIAKEAQSYVQQGNTSTSAGWRLNAWHKSVQSIQEKPLYGFGVGSWAPAVKRLAGERATADFGTGNYSNPHNEYLLWGVELGVVGILLLPALFLLMVIESRKFDEPIRRALISAIVVSAIACLFNSSLYDALIGDYICTALGLLLVMGIHHSSQAKKNQ